MSRELKIAFTGLIILFIFLAAYDIHSTESQLATPDEKSQLKDGFSPAVAFTAFIDTHINNIKRLLDSRSSPPKKEENGANNGASSGLSSLGDKYFTSARVHFLNKNYKEAILMGELALEFMNTNSSPGGEIAKLREFLADAYSHNNEYGEAAEEYKVLLELDPENVSYKKGYEESSRAWNNSQCTIARETLKSGEKSYDSCDYLQGIDCSEKALALFEKHNGSYSEIASCYALEGKCQMKMGYYPRAKKCIDEAIKANPSETSYGAILKEIARLSEAPPAATSYNSGSSATYSGSGYPQGTSLKVYHSSVQTSSFFDKGTYYVTPDDPSGSNKKIVEQNRQIMEDYERQRQETQARNRQIIESHTRTYSNPGSSHPGSSTYSNPYSSAPSYNTPGSSSYGTGPSFNYGNPSPGRP